MLRITSRIMTSRAMAAMQQHLRRIGTAQEQTVTGLRVNRPSDDPLAMRSILNHRAFDQRLESQLANTRDARGLLNNSVSQLIEVKNALVQAKNVALESPQVFDRGQLAFQVDQLLDRTLQIANAEIGSQYLFGGTRLSSPPFARRGNGPVEYQGARERMRIALGSHLQVDILFRGDEVFQPRDRQATVYVGATGAAAGRGTDSGIGRGTLEVRHVSTTYEVGSGIQAGTSSATGDTVLGAAGSHHLVIDDTSGTGASGTIQLDGGPPVTFTNADTNLKVTGINGEVVYVDTTSITAGFSGSVALTAAGTLSVDGGATEVPIDFTDNQTVVDSATGRVTFVDSTAIRLAGEDRVEYVGTSDIFQTLEYLRDDLLNVDGITEAEWQESSSRLIGEFDRLIDQVLSVVGQQSAVLENLDAVEDRFEDLQLETRRILSELQSADIPQVVIEMQSEQNLLNFTYASTARLFDQDLLDFI